MIRSHTETKSARKEVKLKMNCWTKGFAAMWSVAIARYLVVGVANTAFSYSIYAGALLGGASYPLASLISLAAGILLSFKTQGTLVFKNPRNRLFGRFALAWTFAYGVNTSLIGLFVHLGLNALMAGALALPFNVVVGFVLQRYFVFGKIKSLADREN
jgi:putative flippase GtrA